MALNFFKTNYLDAMSAGPHMVFKKPSYPISSQLKAYLDRYKRSTEVPVHYDDLLRFSGSVSVYSQQDDDTLWVRVFYSDEERKMEVVAWYTDKLGMFIGPETFGSLPGVILAVDVNNAERTIVALNVENKKLGKNDIKVPTTGTPISGKEFRAMVQEEMKKRGGTFIIRN